MSIENDIKRVMSEMGKRSANKLTPKERKERASKAVKKRWKIWYTNNSKDESKTITYGKKENSTE